MGFWITPKSDNFSTILWEEIFAFESQRFGHVSPKGLSGLNRRSFYFKLFIEISDSKYDLKLCPWKGENIVALAKWLEARCRKWWFMGGRQQEVGEHLIWKSGLDKHTSSSELNQNWKFQSAHWGLAKATSQSLLSIFIALNVEPPTRYFASSQNDQL